MQSREKYRCFRESRTQNAEFSIGTNRRRQPLLTALCSGEAKRMLLFSLFISWAFVRDATSTSSGRSCRTTSCCCAKTENESNMYNANDLNQHDRRASPSGSQPSNQQKRWQKWLSPHPISCSACGAFIFWGYKGHNSNRHAAIVVWVKGPSQNYTFTKKNIFFDCFHIISTTEF